jgi:hypothetical protein
VGTSIVSQSARTRIKLSEAATMYSIRVINSRYNFGGWLACKGRLG